jgi:hypothetical protein
MPSPDPHAILRANLRSILVFTREASQLPLRKYQEPVVQAIVDSVINQRGLSIVVLFPRQSGKNELQAQIEAYLMIYYMTMDMDIVKVCPTWSPQSENAMQRLQRVLERNLICRGRWTKQRSYIYRLGTTRVSFLSGSPSASVVGATANLLLQCDEAQDVSIAKWDKDFAPMVASTNATCVFWGTAWTSRTLLARELRAAQDAQGKDGIRRVFRLTANQVAREVPAYRQHLAGKIARLGRNHPLVKTQYFSEEIDSQGGMFPPERRALMKGDHSRQLGPGGQPFGSHFGQAGDDPPPHPTGGPYAFLIDVAGEDEAAADLVADLEKDQLRNPARNATALTIIEADRSTLTDEHLRAMTYRVVDRRSWIGVSHSVIYGQLNDLAHLWDPRYVVVDATGVGAGLASFLGRSLRCTVLPFVFTPQSKSKLGWDFLAICDTGRFKDHHSAQGSDEYTRFWNQLQYVEYEALAKQTLRWSVPDGTRDLVTGELVHDDLVMSAALCAILDQQEWYLGGPTLIVRARDPLDDIDRGIWRGRDPLEGMDRNY